MVRIALVVASIVMFPLTSFGGRKEEAQAVVDKFIAAFVAGDSEGTAALYSPDALFWGTVSPELGPLRTFCERISPTTMQLAPKYR